MTKLESAIDCIDYVRSQSDSCILFLSLGKDSLVTLDLIYPRFKRVVCVFMYFVKGLEHIERWVRWCKARYPNIEFVQVPHWNLTYLLRGGLYSVPNPDIKLLKLADVVNTMRIKYGIEHCFLGMKKADGMNRNLMLRGYANDHYVNKGMCYPLAEWNQKEILSYMRHHGLPEPVRYSLAASSGVGFSLDCFLWMRENGFEGDLEKIYAVFPMSRRILFEYDYKKANEQIPEDTAEG